MARRTSQYLFERVIWVVSHSLIGLVNVCPFDITFYYHTSIIFHYNVYFSFICGVECVYFNQTVEYRRFNGLMVSPFCYDNPAINWIHNILLDFLYCQLNSTPSTNFYLSFLIPFNHHSCLKAHQVYCLNDVSIWCALCPHFKNTSYVVVLSFVLYEYISYTVFDCLNPLIG